MTDQTASASYVDQSPIDKLERRNSLEKHLALRPEEQDLKNRHILLDTTAAPALQARQAELERQRITDNLKKVLHYTDDMYLRGVLGMVELTVRQGLSKRPEKDELVDRNILPDSTAAPALQEKQRELEKHMRANSLEKQLQSRPGKDELVKGGILNGEWTRLDQMAGGNGAPC